MEGKAAQENMRNAPRQDRAEDTVSVILEATAQVLDTSDEPRFTTNHVARRAGVSIGTLYRYFSNKQSILDVLIKRELSRRERQMMMFLDENQEMSGQELLEKVVDITLSAFSGRARVRRYLVKRVQTRSDFAEMFRQTRLRILARVEEHLVRVEPHLYKPTSTPEKYALLGAWVGSINATLIYSCEDLKSNEFRRHLVTLMDQHFRH